MSNLTVTYKNILLTIDITYYTPFAQGRNTGHAHDCCEDTPEQIEWNIIDALAPNIPTDEQCQYFASFVANQLSESQRQKIHALISKEIQQQRATGTRRHRDPSNTPDINFTGAIK